jgi:hypothetical protein
MGIMRFGIAGGVMRGGRTRVFASGAVGAAMIVALGAAAPAAGLQARSAAVTDFKFGLNGVSVLSSSDAWAVGESSTVLHWNGTSWARVTIPGVTGADLSAVDALSPSNVWAVGLAAGEVFARENTLIVHWNGTAWKRVPSPGSFDTNNVIPSLSSVSMDSATDGWAVGSVSNKRTGATTALALHWNGTSWQRVTTSPGLSFTGVASFPPSNATAVGTHQTSTFVFTPVAFHWNGTSWAQAAALPPPHGVPASQLAGPYSLSAPSATDMWTVGGYFASAGVKNLAWHWNGTRWTVIPMSLVTAVGSGMTAAAALSPTNVWAVGYANTTSSKQSTVAAHWNGTRWTRVATPSPSGSDVLLGVGAAGPGNVWAVGNSNATHLHHTLILHWNGSSWVQS